MCPYESGAGADTRATAAATVTLTAAVSPPRPDDDARLAGRVEAAEAALRQAALGRPDALALLEEVVLRLVDTFAASAGVAFVVSGAEGVLVRCAASPPGAVPDLVELDPDTWPAGRSAAAASPGAPDADALLAALGAPHALLLPVGGAAPGVVVLARASPFAEAERLAGARLAALFSTLWAWTDAEARFQRTVADLDDALFTFGHDAQGRRAYAFVTPQAESITGLDPDAILAGDADWAALVHPDDRAAFDAHDARLRAGEPSRVDVRLVLSRAGRDAAGPDETVWISERATPSLDAAGRPVAGGLLSDVTAQKAAEATLDRARRVAERASDARMAFLRLMSHELRTPLGAIRGFADLLADEVAEMPDAPAVVVEFTATIGAAATRALGLVSDLLDLSRLETESLDLARVPVDVAALVRAAADRAAPDLAARGVALYVHADRSVFALADAARLGQVVGQLLGNAATFTEHGSVTVRVAATAGTVVVSVADTGAGIDEVFLESLFEPFAQEDTRVNRDREGTGLGLAIARRLVSAMGGRLSVESAKGVGSTFTVTLPAAESPAAAY